MFEQPIVNRSTHRIGYHLIAVCTFARGDIVKRSELKVFLLTLFSTLMTVVNNRQIELDIGHVILGVLRNTWVC